MKVGLVLGQGARGCFAGAAEHQCQRGVELQSLVVEQLEQLRFDVGAEPALAQRARHLVARFERRLGLE
jgi:hypothetical protein